MKSFIRENIECRSFPTGTNTGEFSGVFSSCHLLLIVFALITLIAINSGGSPGCKLSAAPTFTRFKSSVISSRDLAEKGCSNLAAALTSFFSISPAISFCISAGTTIGIPLSFIATMPITFPTFLNVPSIISPKIDDSPLDILFKKVSVLLVILFKMLFN